MQKSATDRLFADVVATHPLDPDDAVITAAIRAGTLPAKGAARVTLEGR